MNDPTTRHWMSRICATAAAAALVWGLAAGCDDDRSGAPDGGSAEADTEPEESDGTSLERERSAYGLPLPPKTRDVQRLPNGTEVTTGMEIDALEKFFETRLVDYEIVRPSPQKIRAIGLREFMPAIRGHRYGPITVLYYAPSREEPDPDAGTRTPSDTGTGIEGPAVGAPDEERRDQPEPGTPVRLETEDGEPLAPGARWGEPYTPPEGSPLDKPRYRANFGKPFGEWQLP